MRHSILRSLVLCGLVLPACIEPDGGISEGDVGSGEMVASTFQLTKTRAMAGELPIVGIDSDRVGGLWIAYRLQSGGYASPADVRVVHLDVDGRKRSEWEYTDESTAVSGLAFSGDAVWLNYADSSNNNQYIRKLDPTNGRVLDTFALQYGIVDVDVYGDELRLSLSEHEVIALDLTTGAERWRTPVPGNNIYGYSQRGIATTADDKLWVVPDESYANNQILLLDPQHHVIGAGITDELTYGGYTSFGQRQLAWDGDELILVVRNQIIWLALPPSVSGASQPQL